MHIIGSVFLPFRRNDALRNKCTQLQKSKTDAGHKIDTLLNAVKEKEIELETLKKQLAR